MSAASSLRRKMAKAERRDSERNEVAVPPTPEARRALLAALVADRKLSPADEARARKMLGMDGCVGSADL